MTEIVATILWQRLDVPGHDACRLIRQDDGWELHGHAIFEHEGEPCSLAYAALCDKRWQARSASVRGFLGTRDLSFDIERSPDGEWLLNGDMQPGLKDLIDVDLGFTPATNLQQLLHADLGIGDEAAIPAAWFDIGEATLVRLPQHYRRLAADRYHYSSPTAGYEATLEMAASGFVRLYPGLWEMVPDA